MAVIVTKVGTKMALGGKTLGVKLGGRRHIVYDFLTLQKHFLIRYCNCHIERHVYYHLNYILY